MDSKKVFFILLPGFIMVAFCLCWLFGVIALFDWEVDFLWSECEYGYNFTAWAARWLKNYDHGFFSAITVGLIQIILIVFAAIFDTLVIYVLFYGVGTIIYALLQLVLMLGILFALPLGCFIWSIINLRRSDSEYSWVCVLSLILTIIAIGTHLVFLIPALQHGF
ncbi:MAG: hypothetical protein E7339_07320 [Clostridiales bacterium]|nr:hypothetical protein [Clostridiales bacterium]